MISLTMTLAYSHILPLSMFFQNILINDEYACKILKKIQKDPMIEKIIKEQHKSQVQYGDKNISL